MEDEGKDDTVLTTLQPTTKQSSPVPVQSTTQQLSAAQQSQQQQQQQQKAQQLQQQQRAHNNTAKRRNTSSAIPTELPSIAGPFPHSQPQQQQQFSPSPSLVQPQFVNGFHGLDATQLLYSPIQNHLRSSTARQPSPQARERRSSRPAEVAPIIFQGQIGYMSTPSIPQRSPGLQQQQQQLSPRHSVPNMQQKIKVQNSTGTQVNRPPFKTHNSSSSISTSLPTTPRHPRTNYGKSRSPSPPTYSLDSPRSAASDPASTYHPSSRPLQSNGCPFEGKVYDAPRRRMAYNLGTDDLPKEKPVKESLSTEDEALLTKDMDALYQELLPSDESNERRAKFVMKLEKLLNEEWPGKETRALPFGSTENKLCTTDSDVDICIMTNMKEMENVCMLAKALKKHGMENVVCISAAKVPIVKIWDPEYKVSCDMNVNNPLALDNTRMMKTYVDIDPRVRPLAMIIKHWTKQRILKDAGLGGTISSYTWICIIINFLQMRHPPILPALHQRPHENRPLVHGIDVSFDDNLEKLEGFGEQNSETLGALLFAFFKKFGYEMDYENKVISVRHGKLLSKDEKGFRKLANHKLCVEEPFNTDRSLSNGADDTSVKGLHLEFRRAYKALAEGKPNLALLCEEYVFPAKEESSMHNFIRPSAHRPTVNLTRSHSQSGQRRMNGSITPTAPKGRYHSNYGAPRSNAPFNRRASSGAAIAGNGFQHPQLYQSPEPYIFVPTSDGTFTPIALSSLQRPIQLQQQQARDAQINRQAQQQGRMNSTDPAASSEDVNSAGQQNQTQQQAQYGGISVNAQQAMNMVYPMMQHIYYINQNGGIEVMPNPLMMHSNNGSLDPRSSFARGGRNQTRNGLRSRSQPAPQGDVNGFRANNNRPMQNHNSADEQDFGDFPMTMPKRANTSNMTLQPNIYGTGYAPEPLLEEQYYGFMYQDSNDRSPEAAKSGSLNRGKRLSKERLQSSNFGGSRKASQPPSPILIGQARYGQPVPDQLWSSSDGDGERSVSQDSLDEEPRSKGPLIVNGSGTIPATPPHDDASYGPSVQNDSPQSDIMFHSAYGTDESMSNSIYQLEQPQRYIANVFDGAGFSDAKSMGTDSPNASGPSPYTTLQPPITFPSSSSQTSFHNSNPPHVDLAPAKPRQQNGKQEPPIPTIKASDITNLLHGTGPRQPANKLSKSWTEVTKAEATRSANNGKPMTPNLNKKKSDIVDISRPRQQSSANTPKTPVVAKNAGQRNNEPKSQASSTQAKPNPPVNNLPLAPAKPNPFMQVKTKKKKSKKSKATPGGELAITIPSGEEKKGG